MSAAPVRTRRPKDRRQTLEAAAAALFAERGFAGTGVADIAAEVGITPGAIYRHFSSKEDLLERIVLGSLSRIDEMMDSAVPADDGADSETRVRAMAGAMLDITQANRDFVATYLRERHRLTDAARSRRQAKEKSLYDRITALILDARPGVTPLDMVMRVRALNGALGSVGTRRQTVPWPRLRGLFLDSLTSVLLAPADRPAATTPVVDRQWSPPRSRREDILAAATRLFRRHGYHGVGIDDIGEAAGIAGPTVYGNYASKSEILVDAVERAVAMVDVLTERAMAGGDSPAEALGLLALSFAETVMTNRDIVAVATTEFRALPEADSLRIGRTQADFRQRAAAVLVEQRPELTHPEARALMVASYSLVEGVALERRLGTPSNASMADLMVRFLLGGTAADRALAATTTASAGD